MQFNQDKLLKLARPAIALISEPEVSCGVADPHFWGNAYAEKGSKWPICKGCKQGMFFFAQVKFHEDLFCFYFCGVCIGRKEAHLQPDGLIEVLRYEAPAEDRYSAITATHKIKASPVYHWLYSVRDIHPAVKIKQQQFQCLPAPQEFLYFLRQDKELAKPNKDLPLNWEALYAVEVARLGCKLPRTANQFGGYAMERGKESWQGGFQLVKCRKCDQKMDLYLQTVPDEARNVYGHDRVFHCQTDGSLRLHI